MMIKKKIKNLELEIYEETLSNGLRIFVVPNNKVKNVYMTFSTKYGSIDSEFVPIDGKDMIKVPDGIAHFLEHKLFEQEDGVEPFEYFSKSGSDVNANTSNYKTTYLFIGQKNIKENINYLLDFVQSPYFTDENVEKERGIITEELEMYKDDPITCSIEEATANSFVKHPIRIPVGGTVSSIKKIDKETLYKCYNSFYHPSNMFIVITGKINPKKAIDIIKKNQKQKQFSKFKEIKRIEYNEPDTVFKKSNTIYKNVTIPKLTLGYKFRIDDFKMETRKILTYISFYMRIKFGQVSELFEELSTKELISSDINFLQIKTDRHILLLIEVDTKQPEELEKIIDNEIRIMNIEKNEFEREHKVAIAGQIYMSDNIYRVNNFIMNSIINYDKIDYNRYSFYKKLNFNEFKEFTDGLNFDNKTTLFTKRDK